MILFETREQYGLQRVTKPAAEAVLDGDIKGWRRFLPF